MSQEKESLTEAAKRLAKVLRRAGEEAKKKKQGKEVKEAGEKE